MSKQRKWQLAAVLIPIEVLLTVLAWRDLNRRTEDRVTGRKRLWRIFIAVNPGNAILYWLLGRRQ